MKIRKAEKLAPKPTWAGEPSYARNSHRDGKGVLITDTATLHEDPFVRIGMEWQITVRNDGTVETLESLRVDTGDDTAYIDTKLLSHVLAVVQQGARKAGVTL